jgi:ornithine carbamoyltransferase
VVATANELADRSGARVTVSDDIATGVAGVDFVYTDVWVSMGEPREVWEQRLILLRPYQVNADLMSAPAILQPSSCTACPHSMRPTPASAPRS